MGKDHLKRLAAPRTWTILRKANTFVTRPKPGRPFRLAMPLSHVFKQVLKKANTTKEARYILHHQEVRLNGKRVYDHRLPVGFMDVLSFPAIKEHYVITLSAKGRLVAVPVDAKVAGKRAVKVRGKTRVRGKTQINCYDGTNVLVDKDTYKVGDSVLIENGKIVKHLPMQEGASIILTGGRHLATIGTVTSIDGRTVIFEADGEELSTAKRHAFVVGTKEPEVPIR